MYGTEKASCLFLLAMMLVVYVRHDSPCSFSSSLSLSDVSSGATTLIMLTVWQSMCVCVYYLLLPLLPTSSSSSSMVVCWNMVYGRACVLFSVRNEWRTRAISSLSQHIILTRQCQHAYTHTQRRNEEDLPISVAQAITPYTHTHTHTHQRTTKIFKKFLLFFFFFS